MMNPIEIEFSDRGVLVRTAEVSTLSDDELELVQAMLPEAIERLWLVRQHAVVEFRNRLRASGLFDDYPVDTRH